MFTSDMNVQGLSFMPKMS